MSKKKLNPDINYELLREVAAMVDGIPARHFQLNCLNINEYLIDDNDKVSSTAVADAIGWMPYHPDFWDFIEFATVYTNNSTFRQTFIKVSDKDLGDGKTTVVESTSVNVLARNIFGINDSDDLVYLFGDATWNETLKFETHKDIFRHRVIKFLKKEGYYKVTGTKPYRKPIRIN